MTEATPEADREPAVERVHRSVITSLAERRQLIEHREEIAALLESDRFGSVDVALGLVLNANRRTHQTNEQ